MEGQAHAHYVPLADDGSDGHPEILPVTGESWTTSERQHRGTKHGRSTSTRSIEAGVYHTRQNPRCMLCKDAPETIDEWLSCLGVGHQEMLQLFCVG